MTNQNERHLRHEMKYYIDFIQYQILRKKLATVLKLDSHGGPDGSYHVRSLYFDDFRDTALFEKQAGIANRKKYRIRIYDYSDSFIKLERKIKLEQCILKESVTLTKKEADRIITGDFSFLTNSKNHLLKRFYLDLRRNLLRPVIFVDYNREAYVHPVGNTRITFDTNLHTSLGTASFFDPDAPTIGNIDESMIILEIKFNDLLGKHIQGLFQSTIKPRSSIGKFVICRTQQICREVEFYMPTRRFSDNPDLYV
jgi:hypothetical protein